MLECQHALVVKGLQELYIRCVENRCFPGEPIGNTENGHPQIHAILDRLGLIKQAEERPEESDDISPHCSAEGQRKQHYTRKVSPKVGFPENSLIEERSTVASSDVDSKKQDINLDSYYAISTSVNQVNQMNHLNSVMTSPTPVSQNFQDGEAAGQLQIGQCVHHDSQQSLRYPLSPYPFFYQNNRDIVHDTISSYQWPSWNFVECIDRVKHPDYD